jgi:hypothetical protein
MDQNAKNDAAHTVLACFDERSQHCEVREQYEARK